MRSARIRRGLVLAALLLAPISAGADFLEQVGDAVRDGTLTLRLSLTAGRVPTAKGWDLLVIGEPEAILEAKAKEGRLESMTFRAPDNVVVLAGHGLRPDVVIQEISADANGRIVTAQFHGRGLGRPVLWLLGGIARGALRKMPLQTSLSQLVRGNLLATAPAQEKASPAPTPTPTPAPSGPPPASFLDLVREARFDGMTLSAFGGRHVDLGDFLSFDTGEDSGSAAPLRLIFERGAFRPGRNGGPSQYDLDFHLEARLAAGGMSFGQDRLLFRQGEIGGGRIQLRQEEGPLFYRVSAERLVLSLDRGDFRFPGGIVLALEEGSRASASGFRLSEHNDVSGVFDLDLSGRTGVIRRAGSRVALESATLKSTSLRFENNHATGDVDLAFGYRLSYPLVVRYPIAGVPPHTVPLEFSGPLTARLSLEGVSSDEGSVTGEYSFKMPWAPVEKAALEALKARWIQDLTPVLKKVEFDIEGTRFGPCGEHCFLVKVSLQAQKGKGRSRLFRQRCAPEGQANLEVDAPERRFVLRHVKLRPQCEGALGWFVNIIAPLLTKSYEDIDLFQMPESLPFSIEAVNTGVDWIQIRGKVSWTPESRQEAGADSGNIREH